MRLMITLFLTLTAPAVAAPVTFDTRAAFTTAAGPLVVEGFDRCTLVSTPFTGPLSANDGRGVCSEIAGGIAFVDDPGPDGEAMFIAGPGQSFNPTTAIGQNNPASDALNIDFTVPVTAVGFDLFQNFGGGVQLGAAQGYTITVYSGLTLVGSFVASVAPEIGGFFGLVSAEDLITRVSINNPLAFDVIDNVAFSGIDGSAPEPASLALLGGAALALAASRRGSVPAR